MHQRVRPCLLDSLAPAVKAGANASNNLDHSGLRALLSFSSDERNALILFKRFVARALDFAIVREKVFAAGFGRNKAKSFVIVEPFHDANFCFQCKS